jgi:hypothetical protein
VLHLAKFTWHFIPDEVRQKIEARVRKVGRRMSDHKFEIMLDGAGAAESAHLVLAEPTGVLSASRSVSRFCIREEAVVRIPPPRRLSRRS